MVKYYQAYNNLVYILYKTTTLSKTDAQKLNRLLKVDLAVGVSEQVYGLVGRECEPMLNIKTPSLVLMPMVLQYASEKWYKQ